MDPFSSLSYLVLEPNSACNLRCPTCTREKLVSEGKRPAKNLSIDELELITAQLRSCPIDTVKLQYLSEPMLHPDLDQLAAHLRASFPRAFMISATNLQYDPEKVPFVKTLGFLDMLYLSIDGTGGIYEQARLGGSYAKLVASLEKIKRLIPTEVRAKKLHINFTLTPNNYRELPAIYKLKTDYGLASVRINLAQNWNEDELNSHGFTQEIIAVLKTYRHDVKGVGGWEFRDCFWPFSGVVIDVYGDVRQCVLNTTSASFGNVFEKPLREIYNGSSRLKRMRGQLERNVPPSSCATCDYKHLSPLLSEILGGRHAINKPRSVEAV